MQEIDILNRFPKNKLITLNPANNFFLQFFLLLLFFFFSPFGEFKTHSHMETTILRLNSHFPLSFSTLAEVRVGNNAFLDWTVWSPFVWSLVQKGKKKKKDQQYYVGKHKVAFRHIC